MARCHGPPLNEKVVAMPHYPDNTRPIRASSTRDYAAQVSGRHTDAGAIIKVSVPSTRIPPKKNPSGRSLCGGCPVHTIVVECRAMRCETPSEWSEHGWFRGGRDISRCMIRADVTSPVWGASDDFVCPSRQTPKGVTRPRTEGRAYFDALSYPPGHGT